MKIAIIGTGIAGLTAAYRLAPRHDITVYEAADRIGGHTATIDVTLDGKDFAIDTGFIVFNDWTYPNFIALMNELDVDWRDSDMSFGVQCQSSGLEYAGVSGRLAMYNSLFAQRRQLASPTFIKMLLHILAFNKQAIADVEADSIPDETLQAYLHRHRLSSAFADYYLVPMTSAIWSTSFNDMLDFPVRFMLPFMYRHGLLNVHHRPRWRTLSGGSRAYLEPMSRSFSDRIRLSTPVESICRQAGHVTVSSNRGEEQYDHVVLACHSDQSLSMLSDPTAAETDLLSAINYQANDVVLHTDTRVMPDNRRAWASWNYYLPIERGGLPRVTYDMNRLMGIESPHRFLVSLNDTDRIVPERILGSFEYAHPVFTRAGADAQARWSTINVDRTWYCGAWWGKGFHEDGVVSALRVVDAIGQLTS
ncbi:NAD(P)/FAD-dependent oxidoreductase [Pseudohongiella spirulinae]|uniref:Amine oxidase, flavin-containing protein n=1 Tax=Pseudohongiella spirulinae TaxID=1249552 RepID=A0A0S2KF55_9GAMM|nr:FAD-dependent oxidoreductase [Pseudohongiella spirulinae]ALO46739.1 Amine oxidase, flavin-containing protein [Pseudohongiella spirulinae]